MPVKTDTYAVERSTYKVQAAFTDETGAAVIPTSITWSLEDDHNRTINSRSAVVVTPASTITIALTGADLQVLDQTKESEVRRLIIAAVYNSSLGSGLNLGESLEFKIYNTNTLTA